MKKILILLLFGVLFACAQAPKQSNYPLSYQKKVQSAHHWEVMAKEVAENAKLALQNMPSPRMIEGGESFGHSMPNELKSEKDMKKSEDSELMTALVEHGRGPIYIAEDDNSSFGRAMRNLLITELENKNIWLVSDEKYAYRLEWSVQKVHHYANRDYKPGLLTTVFIDVPRKILVGGDVWGERPHSEILVTFKLRHNERNLSRRSTILYVCDEDLSQYWAVPDNEFRTKTTSKMKPVSLDVVNN
jgi:hypothetical protein